MTSAVADAPLLEADEIAALAAQAVHGARTAANREVHDHHAGDWPSAWLGRGLDFEEARPYNPGDDLRDMDWRTTARLGQPFIKTYREERQPLLHLVLDRGPGMRFGTRRRLKVTQAARVAVLTGFTATERSIAVGATLWDRLDQTLPARHGRAGLLEMVQAIVAPCPPLNPEIGEALHEITRLQTLRAELPRGSRLMLLSDFAWLAPLHEPALASLAEWLDLLAVCITDPVERELPDVGLACFADQASGQTHWIDTGNAAVRKAHTETFATRHAHMRKTLTRCAVRQLDIGSEVDDLQFLMDHHG